MFAGSDALSTSKSGFKLGKDGYIEIKSNNVNITPSTEVNLYSVKHKFYYDATSQYLNVDRSIEFNMLSSNYGPKITLSENRAYNINSSISLIRSSSTGTTNKGGILFETDSITLNSTIIHPPSLSKSINSDPVIISVCDDLTNMYMLKQENNNYIIDKYTSFDKYDKLFEFTTENTVYNIYYFNNYLLVLSNNGIEYINLLNDNLELIKLLEDNNINKLVIDPNNNQFYVL